jgi:hypothetical protein
MKWFLPRGAFGEIGKISKGRRGERIEWPLKQVPDQVKV